MIPRTPLKIGPNIERPMVGSRSAVGTRTSGRLDERAFLLRHREIGLALAALFADEFPRDEPDGPTSPR